jgi:isopentenyl phosphate kinase
MVWKKYQPIWKNMSLSELQFLKLGGSLITDKTRPRTARPEVLKRLTSEIAATLEQNPEMQLVLGHGSGSFGHVSAKRYCTREGVSSAEGWRGFVEVWRDAAALNRIVMDELHAVGVPAISFPPSAGVIAEDGRICTWNLQPLRAALTARLIPMVYGDVVFDTHRGGTILSTEDLFRYLAGEFHPSRILLAGLDEGVWADYPARGNLIREITPTKLAQLTHSLGGSEATDVTGGMDTKVKEMLELVQVVPGLYVCIFSGNQPGAIREALLGETRGTLIHNGI